MIKTALLRISDFIDQMIDFVGKSVSWLTTVLVILICVDVVMRYFLNATKTWILELEWHLFSIIFLIGASYTLQHDKHVRVDLFYERFSIHAKRWTNMIGILLLLLPWCIIVMKTSWDYTLNSFSFRETSPQPNGLPARYIIKGFIWLGFFLLFLQGVSLFIRSLYHKDSSS